MGSLLDMVKWNLENKIKQVLIFNLEVFHTLGLLNYTFMEKIWLITNSISNDSVLQHCNSLPISLCSVCSQRPTATLGLSYILAKDFRIHFLVEMQGIKSRNFKRCILSAAIILLANRLSTDFTCNYSPMDQL
jgi:hypothetical protein